jgi:RNA polymerase sigma-70 factor (ECF subfamily)
MSDELAGFIRRRVGDPDVAADVLQETFMRIPDGIGGLRDDDRLAAWVYRVARNTIADHFRRPSHDVSASIEPVADEDGQENEASMALGGWLLEMIATLPPPYREAMELSEREGLPGRVIAERLGLSHSGVKSRLQRGRAMLRTMLLDCCHLDLDRLGNVVDYERHGACEICRGGGGDERSCDAC